MIVKRPMIYALIAYVLTECMAYANCSINIFIVLYFITVIVYIKYRKLINNKNNEKAEHESVSAFICVCIIIFLSGLLGYAVMSRGKDIKEYIFDKYEPARNEGNFDERNYKLCNHLVFCDLNKNENKTKVGDIYTNIYPKTDENYNNIVNYITYKYMGVLERIKEFIGRRIDNNCNNRVAPIYRALLIGDKKSISDKDKLLFRVSGISHVFAISGLHISIIGIGLYKLLRKKFMMPFSVLISSFLIINYSLMIGINVSTTRAIVMFLLRMIAEILGRKYDEINGYVISIMIVNSLFPWGFTGFAFQMSFAAIFICYFIIPSVIRFLRINSRILSGIVSSMIINEVLAVLIAIHYYEVYPYTILANALVMPFVGVVLVLGFLGCFRIGSVFIMLGGELCEVIKNLEYSNIVCGKPEIWQLVIIFVLFVVYIIFVAYDNRRLDKNKIETRDFDEYKDLKRISLFKYGITIIVYIMMFAVVLFGKDVKHEVFAALGIDKNCTEVVMVDIGQGDFIYVKTRENLNITFDGGSSDIKDVANYRMVPFLKYKGVGVIDYAFLSHSDDDHTNGIIEMITNYDLYGIRIRNIVISKLDDRDEALCNIVNIARKYGVNVLELEEGDKLLDFTCIMPFRNLKYEDSNAASLVLSYEVKGDNSSESFSILFMGDYNDSEDYVIDRINQYTDVDNYTILKVAHHGSKFSTYENFLEKTKPEYAWISCGIRNRYGHPSKETIDRIKKYTNAKICITSHVGEIKYIYR